MIIVPEIETVVILVPRTGSTALKQALLAKYPKAMRLYRHMEADGVPRGYDRWRRLGVVREPTARLWSVYKFMQEMPARDYPAPYVEACRSSCGMPFSQWLTDNEFVFTAPYDRGGSLRFWPGYCVGHALPENRKSQFVYLRPDLGTDVWSFEELGELAASLGVTLAHENASKVSSLPDLTPAAQSHVERWMAWDLSALRVAHDRVPAPSLPHPEATP